MPHRHLALALTLCALVAVSCGSDEAGDPQVLEAGQVDIRLPDGWKVTDGGAVRPGAGDSAEPGEAAAPAAPGEAEDETTDDTVPLAEEDATTKFFRATQDFRQCLEDLGTAFIGAPDPSNPDSPANAPEYIEDLSTCASKSGIVQAMQDMQKDQEDMTPEEIEEQNEGYLRWRDCMIGKGWKIGEPTPDAEGRLFSFSGGRTPQIEPPPGKDLLGDSDMQECAEEAQP